MIPKLKIFFLSWTLSISLLSKDSIIFSFQGGECLGNASNSSASIDDSSKEVIEEGEFIPCIQNIQMDTMHGPVNGAASYDVAASSGDGSSFQHPEASICDNDNKAEVQHESREGFNAEMGSAAYSKIVTEPRDSKGAKTCCSLVVLRRLHQVLLCFILLHSLYLYIYSNVGCTISNRILARLYVVYFMIVLHV